MQDTVKKPGRGGARPGAGRKKRPADVEPDYAFVSIFIRKGLGANIKALIQIDTGKPDPTVEDVQEWASSHGLAAIEAEVKWRIEQLARDGVLINEDKDPPLIF